MSMIFHPATGFPIADPDLNPLDPQALPSHEEVEEAAAGLILSASGWRKVFASPAPGEPRAPWASGRASAPDEDSLSGKVSAADIVVAGAAALVFYEELAARSGRKDPALLIGIDARPTGPALADAMCRVLLGLGARPRYLFIIAAPEIMAYSASISGRTADGESRVEGFAYISASHNPPAHNGIKFGASRGGERAGGVLPGPEAAVLIAAFKAAIAQGDIAKRVYAAMEAASAKKLSLLYSAVSREKRWAVSAYTLLAREIVSGQADQDAAERFFEAAAKGAAARPIGVLAEMNGSARSLSIDPDFLSGFGAGYRGLNDRPRAFVHRIVPEGESLETARAALEAAHAQDASFALSYVPDCDGDRGNLVIFDERAGHARVLAAQEVFALCCVSELSGLVRDGGLSYGPDGAPSRRVAIAVNDGTSMRIEAIARAFGAEVARAETGEANVIGLAEALRREGAIVRLLGEGSNGGNITYPSAVRDPLATLGAVLKLLLIRDAANGDAAERGLFHIWAERSGQPYSDDFGLAEILASLPSFATTSAFEARAALKIRSTDQTALKARYASLFLAAWAERRNEFQSRLGLVSWKAFASQGSGQREVGEDFAASGKGGLRIVFSDQAGRERAFLWMRGSGTEPVFRVMADIDGGSDSDEAWLLAFHTELVRRADS
jgi:phosphoglucomutase